jgi:hypothetical protein
MCPNIFVIFICEKNDDAKNLWMQYLFMPPQQGVLAWGFRV